MGSMESFAWVNDATSLNASSLTNSRCDAALHPNRLDTSY